MNPPKKSLQKIILCKVEFITEDLWYQKYFTVKIKSQDYHSCQLGQIIFKKNSDALHTVIFWHPFKVPFLIQF